MISCVACLTCAADSFAGPCGICYPSVLSYMWCLQGLVPVVLSFTVVIALSQLVGVFWVA
jgi:hypothetical protein